MLLFHTRFATFLVCTLVSRLSADSQQELVRPGIGADSMQIIMLHLVCGLENLIPAQHEATTRNLMLHRDHNAPSTGLLTTSTIS